MKTKIPRTSDNGFAITIHRANYHSYLISKMDIDEKEKR